MTFSKGKHILHGGGAKAPVGAQKLKGNMLRYIYFIDKSCKEKLTVPVIPFSKIDEMGARMYKGERITRDTKANSEYPSESGGAIPTITLQTQKGA